MEGFHSFSAKPCRCIAEYLFEDTAEGGLGFKARILGNLDNSVCAAQQSLSSFG